MNIRQNSFPSLTLLSAGILLGIISLSAAVAQDRSIEPIPNIKADAWSRPHGSYASFRILLENKAQDRVKGGALNITYEIACATMNPMASCPAPIRRNTKMPCGEDEAGLISVNLSQAPYNNPRLKPYTLTLTIKRIEFNAWDDATVDRINTAYPQRYQYNPNPNKGLYGAYERVDGDTCEKINHSPASVTSQDSDWNAVVTVN